MLFCAARGRWQAPVLRVSFAVVRDTGVLLDLHHGRGEEGSNLAVAGGHPQPAGRDPGHPGGCALVL